MQSSLLKTKLYVPTLRTNNIERLELVNILEEGLDEGRRLFLISAPAGYGKTTIVTEWIKRVSLKVCWFSLDGGDNEPQRFFWYLLAALQSNNPKLGMGVADLLNSPQLPEPEALVTLMINDISSVDEGFMIVLDDYHLIKNQYIHKAIEFLIDNSPVNLSSIIITREDPPFPLGRWRVRNHLTELRIDDLRFSETEFAKFFAQTIHFNLTENQIAQLRARTEGWAAGMQLAAISMQGRGEEDVIKFIDKFNGSNRYVIDYLFEEVLKLQKNEIRKFLCQTSILGRLSASLCQFLTGNPDSKEILFNLEQANIFLIPLDDQRRWYRYHHLFADFLQTELSEEEEIILHQKAAQWFEENFYPHEAIEHYFKANDINNANRLIKSEMTDTLLRGKFFTLLGWLDTLGDQMVSKDGALCSIKACAHFLIAQVQQTLSYVNLFHEIKDADNLSIGRIKVLEAWLANIREEPQTINLARGAIELIGNDDLGLKVFALVALAQAQRSLGNLSESSKAFREALQISTNLGYTLSISTVLMDLVYNIYIQGKLQEAVQICLDTLNGKKTGDKILITAGILNLPLGVFYYEANELEKSEKSAIEGIEASKKLALNKLFGGDGERTLAKVWYLQGRKEEALALLRDSVINAKTAGLPIVVLRFEAVMADLYLKMGELTWVEDWITSSGLSLEGEVTSLKEQPYMIYTRLLLEKQLWSEAKALLGKLENFSRIGQRNGRLINILVLKAKLLKCTGQISEAQQCLKEALKLAEPHNYRRSFLDEGESILELLKTLKIDPSTFISGLINDFQREFEIKHRPLTALPLVEPLSEREIEVLELIVGGLSNGDIAKRLYIGLGTVKWHINHIYGKLMVKSRTQAINKARELGIIK